MKPSRFDVPFTVQPHVTTQSAEGQLLEDWDATSTRVVCGVISTTPADVVDLNGQQTHYVTYSIVARGPAYDGAKPNDRLVGTDGKRYYVQQVENPAQRGRITIYHTRETPSVH